MTRKPYRDEIVARSVKRAVCHRFDHEAFDGKRGSRR